jgi:hypothetical protein
MRQPVLRSDASSRGKEGMVKGETCDDFYSRESGSSMGPTCASDVVVVQRGHGRREEGARLGWMQHGSARRVGPRGIEIGIR